MKVHVCIECILILTALCIASVSCAPAVNKQDDVVPADSTVTSSISQTVSGDETAEKITKKTKGETEPAISITPKWEELSLPEQYRNLDWDGREYTYCGAETEPEGLTLLGESMLNPVWEPIYDNDAHPSVEASILKTQVSSEKYLLAVKITGSDQYWLYRNSLCCSDTLGEYIQETGFYEIAELTGKANLDYDNRKEVDLPGEEFLKNYLEKWKDAPKAEGQRQEAPHAVSIGFYVPIWGFGEHGISMTVDSQGYIEFSQTSAQFFIGEAEAKEFIDGFN